MEKNNTKFKILKLTTILLITGILIYFLLNTTNLIKRGAGTFMIENGSLSYEEEAEGYIIRDEEVLKGEDSSNGITQIVTEGTRVAKNEAVFRYYSNNEEELTSQIEQLDKQIDEELSKQESQNSIVSLELEIKKDLDEIFKENNLQNIREYKKRINNCIVKKSELAGNLSPEGSYVRKLIEQRTDLSNKLTRRFRNNYC